MLSFHGDEGCDGDGSSVGSDGSEDSVIGRDRHRKRGKAKELARIARGNTFKNMNPDHKILYASWAMEMDEARLNATTNKVGDLFDQFNTLYLTIYQGPLI